MAVALALIGIVVPAAPASAAPVASTVRLIVDDYAYTPEVTLNAQVAAAVLPGPAASGTVVFTEGGTELGRATIGSGSGRLLVTLAPGPHTITVDYLGSTELDPSSTTTTETVQTQAANAGARAVSGTVAVGSENLAVGPASYFAMINATAVYNPTTGVLYSNRTMILDIETTVDVPGSGPVTVAVRPYLGSLQGTMTPEGTLSLDPTTLRLLIVRITVGGTTWASGKDLPGGCSFLTQTTTLSGAVDATGLALSGAATPDLDPIDPAACDGRAALVNAVLGGSVSLDLHIEGPFPPPPPPNTPTTTTVSVVGSGFTVGDRVTVQAAVVAAGGFIVPPGAYGVDFSSEGVVVATASVINGVATALVPVDLVGTNHITATYDGFVSGGVTLLSPSSDSTTVEVGPAPPGRPASGQLTIGTNIPAAFPDGTRLTGAPFDPATGAIGSGAFWLPAGEFLLDTHIVGILPARYRLVQVGDMTGQVDPDGTVTFTAATFEWEGRAYNYSGTWSTLTNCTFGPIVMTLTGTADAGGLHLTANDVTIPPVPAGGCSGLSGFVNDEMAAGGDFTFEVPGDFARSDGTPVEAVSWYPTVDQYNQSFLSAAVDSGGATPTPTGAVTFRDGPTVLGTAPIDATGHAGLVVALDQPGTRTITAAYPGDADHAAGSDTTTVEVTPAPVGYAMNGTITVAGTDIDIAAGSQLLPQTPAPGGPGRPATAANGHDTLAGALAASSAAMWFMPTTITIDTPTYGTVDAEVRLNQYGALAPASIGTGGTIDGLAGTFVLQVRTVTTTAGTTTPLGCVNLVMFAFDGTLSFTDITIDTAGGGTGRIPWGTCTGPGKEVIERLTGGTTTATIHATL